jgi:hypothetical protein
MITSLLFTNRYPTDAYSHVRELGILGAALITHEILR